MSNGPRLNLLTGAAARLREARSARLISWVTIGHVAVGDEDVNARGVTNFEALQTRAWLEESGRLRRISYAPLPANTTEPFWTTLELFDFGTPLAIPQLAADQAA